jgi:hypothetical protein
MNTHTEMTLFSVGRPTERQEISPRRRKPFHPLTTVLESGRSSWIHAVTYLPRHDVNGKGFLLIFTREPGKPESVLTYADVPYYLKGLLLAGKNGDRSIGRAYHRLLKGKFPAQQTYTSPGNVAELKKMFGLGESITK